MSTTKYGTFHPEIKVIDPKRGTVEYTVSDETIDSSGEVVCAAGADFSRFEKNAPVLDSHSYNTVDSLLGKVIDYGVSRRKVIETVQFAIDVLSNVLAQKAFAMVEAGYLKSCSIGFIPLQIARPSDPRGDWQDACASVGMGDMAAGGTVSCIYQKWMQLELSICCIGSNANAVALKSAYQAGILEDADLLRWPSVRRAIQSIEPASHRSYSFPPSQPQITPPPMSKALFLDKFTGKLAAAPTVKQASDNIEAARRGQSESELFRASAAVRYAMARERRVTAHDRAAEILSDGPTKDFLNVLPRYLAGVSLFNGGSDYSIVGKSLTPGSGTFGGTMLPIGVALSVWDLILINGAFRELGVVSLSTMETKVVQATANPTASWLTPSQIGNTITADTTLTGNNTTPECNSLGILLPVSRELLQDNKVNLAFYLLTRFSEALAGAIDYASLQGDGTADAANGGITGLWADSTVSKVNAASGNTTVASLLRSDFLAAVSACAPAALQRECKWIISPSLLTPLMALVDTNAKAYLLQTPSATGGPWKLCGFDVVWAAQAPATQTAGSTIAIFGHLPSYLVAIREELEVMLRDGNTGFQSNEKSFRAMARAFCQTRAASGLVKFALAAS